MMQTAQMLLSELVDKVSKCSKNRLEMQIVGADVAVSRFMSPAEAGEGDMSFLTDPRYAEAMKATKAAAIVLRERDAKALFGEELPNRTMLLCDDPYAFFAFASQIFYPVKRSPGIHPRAFVEESAFVDPTASIEPMAVVQAGAKVGANTLISAGAYIGEDCDIGRDCVIYPNAVLQAGTVVATAASCSPAPYWGVTVSDSHPLRASGSRSRSAAARYWALTLKSAPTRRSIAARLMTPLWVKAQSLTIRFSSATTSASASTA